MNTDDTKQLESAPPAVDPMPVFVLKDKDALAPGLIDAYRREAARHGLDDHARQVSYAFTEMAHWQQRHPELVKLPDHQHVSAEDQARAAAGEVDEARKVLIDALGREDDDVTPLVELATELAADKCRLVRQRDESWLANETLRLQIREMAAVIQRDALHVRALQHVRDAMPEAGGDGRPEPKAVLVADREGDEWRRNSGVMWHLADDGRVRASDEELAGLYGPLTVREYAGARATRSAGPLTPDEVSRRLDGPVHDWFGLTYATNAVVPRTLAQSMPLWWQARFVAVMEEIRSAFAHIEVPEAYRVDAARESTYGDLTDAEGLLLGVTWQLADTPYKEGAPPLRYFDRDGAEHDPQERVLVPVPDPVPNYDRGRTFVQPWGAKAETGPDQEGRTGDAPGDAHKEAPAGVGRPSEPGDQGCSYTGRFADAQPPCGAQPAVHLAVESPDHGLVGLAACTEHKAVALRAGEVQAAHVYRDGCDDAEPSLAHWTDATEEAGQ